MNLTTAPITAPISAGHLDDLARRIDECGIGAVEADLAPVVAAAERAGVCSVLLAVLTDDREPAVARARAFGRTAADLVAAGHHPASTGPGRVGTRSHRAPTSAAAALLARTR